LSSHYCWLLVAQLAIGAPKKSHAVVTSYCICCASSCVSARNAEKNSFNPSYHGINFSFHNSISSDFHNNSPATSGATISTQAVHGSNILSLSFTSVVGSNW
jgi:hypothetical protein